MPVSLEEIVELTRDLPPDVVADLVDRILRAQQERVDHNVEAAWKTEIHRRIDEIRSGNVQARAFFSERFSAV